MVIRHGEWEVRGTLVIQVRYFCYFICKTKPSQTNILVVNFLSFKAIIQLLKIKNFTLPFLKKMEPTQPYIEYLNKLQRANFTIQNLQQLSSGIFLHETLSSLKEYQLSGYLYDVINEQSTATFIHNMKNIKSLLKALEEFWENKRHKQADLQIDSIKIAKDGNVQEIKKLTKLFIKTLFHSQEKHLFIEKVLWTSQETQQFFMGLMQEQTQIHSVDGRSPIRNKKTNQSLYDRLLELQQQNEQLLKLIEQVSIQSQQHLAKEKDLEEKLDERQTQIKRLNWRLNQLNERKFHTQNNDWSVLEEQRKLNDSLKEKVKEMEERERLMVLQLQSMKEVISLKNQEMKGFQAVSMSHKSMQQMNLDLSQERDSLRNTLESLKQRLFSVEQQVVNQSKIISENSVKIDSLQTSLKCQQEQLLLKQQVIEQLQYNIRYLSQPSTQPHSPQQRSSIKSQCRQLLHVQNHPSTILHLQKQNQSLTSQVLCLTQQTSELQKQLQRLRLFEQQNKKLVQMISHMHKYRGEENQVLVKCLYKMRMKMLGKEVKGKMGDIEGKEGRVLAEVNRNC